MHRIDGIFVVVVSWIPAFEENDEELNHLNCNAAVSFASLAALCC